MATPIWIGTTSTWTTAANWSPATAPLDADSVYFTGAVTQSVDGLALGAGADDFALLSVHEDWAADIGSSGTPVTAGSITKFIYSARSGRCYLNTDTAKTMTQAIVRASSGRSDALRLGGAGTITNLRINNSSGGITLTGIACTTVEMTNSPNCVLTIEGSVTGLTTISILGGGTIDNSAVVTTGTGTVKIVGGRYIRRSVGTIDQLDMYGYGVTSIVEDYGSGAITAGTISGPGAMYDGRRNRNLAVSVSASVYDRARLECDNGLSAYTLVITTDGNALIDAGTATITYV